MKTPRGFRKLTVIDLPRRWRRRYGGRNTSLEAMAILTCVARAWIYPGTSIISSTSRSLSLSSSQGSSTFFSGWSSCCCRCLALSKEKSEAKLGTKGRRRTDDRSVEKGDSEWETSDTGQRQFFHVKVIEDVRILNGASVMDRNKSAFAENSSFTRTIEEKAKALAIVYIIISFVRIFFIMFDSNISRWN